MHLRVVDAFTDRPFSGNPAAVAVVDRFPSETRMQEIAAEMNLSETAFAVPRPGGDHDLRWFTPTTEVDLCGHATLAAAHLIGGAVVFHTRSGPLACRSVDGRVELDFPALLPTPEPLPAPLPGAAVPRWTGVAGGDWLVELARPDDVTDFVADQPGLAALGALGRRAVVLTAAAAPGSDHDIVSRVFGPNVGIPEDPVTGSAHCALAPYWAPRLGRDELVGYQASRRGGRVWMHLHGDRVALTGQAVTVAEVELRAG